MNVCWDALNFTLHNQALIVSIGNYRHLKTHMETNCTQSRVLFRKRELLKINRHWLEMFWIHFFSKLLSHWSVTAISRLQSTNRPSNNVWPLSGFFMASSFIRVKHYLPLLWLAWWEGCIHLSHYNHISFFTHPANQRSCNFHL